MVTWQTPPAHSGGKTACERQLAITVPSAIHGMTLSLLNHDTLDKMLSDIENHTCCFNAKESDTCVN